MPPWQRERIAHDREHWQRAWRDVAHGALDFEFAMRRPITQMPSVGLTASAMRSQLA